MNQEITLTLLATVLFAILASKHAVAGIRKVKAVSEEVSMVIRTVLFALLFLLGFRML